MENYLGEIEVDIKDTPYEKYKPSDWVLLYLFKYSQIDGSHHKQWLLDQTARILNGTKIVIKLAKWSNGEEEYRFSLAEPSKKYLKWVQEYCGEYDDEEECYEYSYDEGTPP